MGVIIANVLLMASDHWSPSEGFATVYTHGMTVFSYIYYCEATLKIAALGLNYFRDNWCRFDFFLVCTTLLDQFGHELLEAVLPLPPMLLRVLRVLRILRVLRLLKDKRFKGLKDLLMTLVHSAPALVACNGVHLRACSPVHEPATLCTGALRASTRQRRLASRAAHLHVRTYAYICICMTPEMALCTCCSCACCARHARLRGFVAAYSLRAHC